MKKLLLALSVLGVGVSSIAAGFPDQTKLMITDAEQSQMVGFGTIENGEMRLELSGAAGTVVQMFFITPDGQGVPLSGLLQADGSVMVVGETGDVDLAAWLEAEDIELEISETTAEVQEDDDEVLTLLDEPALESETNGSSAAPLVETPGTVPAEETVAPTEDPALTETPAPGEEPAAVTTPDPGAETGTVEEGTDDSGVTVADPAEPADDGTVASPPADSGTEEVTPEEPTEETPPSGGEEPEAPADEDGGEATPSDDGGAEETPPEEAPPEEDPPDDGGSQEPPPEETPPEETPPDDSGAEEAPPEPAQEEETPPDEGGVEPESEEEPPVEEDTEPESTDTGAEVPEDEGAEAEPDESSTETP